MVAVQTAARGLGCPVDAERGLGHAGASGDDSDHAQRDERRVKPPGAFHPDAGGGGDDRMPCPRRGRGARWPSPARQLPSGHAGQPGVVQPGGPSERVGREPRQHRPHVIGHIGPLRATGVFPEERAQPEPGRGVRRADVDRLAAVDRFECVHVVHEFVRYRGPCLRRLYVECHSSPPEDQDMTP